MGEPVFGGGTGGIPGAICIPGGIVPGAIIIPGGGIAYIPCGVMYMPGGYPYMALGSIMGCGGGCC